MKNKKFKKLKHKKEMSHYIDPNDLKEKDNKTSYLKEIAGLATILGAGVTGGAMMADDRVYAAESSVDRKSEIIGSNSITGSIDEEVSNNNQKTASATDSNSVKLSQSQSTEQSVTYSKSRSLLASMSLSTSTSFSQSASASAAVSLSESASASTSAAKSTSSSKSKATSKASTKESTSQKSESKSTAENTKTSSESESVLAASSVSKNNEGSASDNNSQVASLESISTLNQKSLNITNLTVNPQNPVDLSKLFGVQLVQLNGAVNASERKLAQATTSAQDNTNNATTLSANSATPLNVGEGEGTLVDTTTTAQPPMTNANGAKVEDQTIPSPYAPTSKPGWHTVTYFSTSSYDSTQNEAGHTGLNAYMRYSYNSDASNYTVLAELVSFSNGNVLESTEINPGDIAYLSYPTQLDPNNTPVFLNYDNTTAINGSPGTIHFSSKGQVWFSSILPAYGTNTTWYKTEDGQVIAYYKQGMIGGQTVTPSGRRDFAGYDYSHTISASKNIGLTPGTTFISSKSTTEQVKQMAVVQDINGAVKKEFWYLDPTYKGKVDWDGNDMTGFIKVLETSTLDTYDGSGYSWNTNSQILAPYTSETLQRLNNDHTAIETVSGMTFWTSPDGKQKLVGRWSGDAKHGGTPYGRWYWELINHHLATDAPITDGKSGKTFRGDFWWLEPNVGHGGQWNLRGTLSPATNETTYVYTINRSESTSISEYRSTSTVESLSVSEAHSESVSESERIHSESTSVSASESERIHSESLSNSISQSGSLSKSERIHSESTSNSVSMSESLSNSMSMSESLSNSVSMSESLSNSVSMSESLSNSVSMSESLSNSVSMSESLSNSVSMSESLSNSVSMSES
ncbi:hypothetical protein RON47_08315, partial [Lactobacillus johnsonii]|nr:hypothetical protein [Lactobacillus johnsonii]